MKEPRTQRTEQVNTAQQDHSANYLFLIIGTPLVAFLIAASAMLESRGFPVPLVRIGTGAAGLILQAIPFMLLGALVLGVSAGPASALLGFFMLDRIPEASRGSALGTQNSLLLAAAPVAVFATSVGVSALGTSVAAVVLVGCWVAITAFALAARGMRNLDDAAPDLKRKEGALEDARFDS